MSSRTLKKERMDHLEDETIEVLEPLEWRERAFLTLRALEGYDTGQIGYCLRMNAVSTWMLSRRTRRAVRKLLKSKTTRWDTPEAFCRSLQKMLDEEIRGDQ
jgi:DNA-directed RNA polymerase specialized sigma24 family protein